MKYDKHYQSFALSLDTAGFAGLGLGEHFIEPFDLFNE